jgi:hypothetical protein
MITGYAYIPVKQASPSDGRTMKRWACDPGQVLLDLIERFRIFQCRSNTLNLVSVVIERPDIMDPQSRRRWKFEQHGLQKSPMSQA